MYLSEYLPRLNAISVVLDFEEDVKDITGVSVKGNELTITAKSPKVVTLPKNEGVKLTSLKKNNNTLSVALQCQTKSVPNNFMSLLDSQLWSCRDLLKTPKDPQNRNVFTFACASCEEPLIDSTTFTKFSDMPSELWAEMMDFWHCHKPDTEQSRHHTKNYSGNMTPSTESVVVGNCYFLLNKNSSIPWVVSKDSVTCRCGSKLGEPAEGGGVKVFKWNTVLKYGTTVESYPQYLYAYNVLLDKINLNATRKLVMNGYIIWIFNIGVDMATHNVQFTKGLKILYTKDTQDDIFDDNIDIEPALFTAFLNKLDDINDNIPVQVKSLQVKEDDRLIEYKVSYIGI